MLGGILSLTAEHQRPMIVCASHLSATGCAAIRGCAEPTTLSSLWWRTCVLRCYREALPAGVRVERLVETEPVLLDVQIGRVLQEIRRLLPAEDPAQVPHGIGFDTGGTADTPCRLKCMHLEEHLGLEADIILIRIRRFSYATPALCWT